MNSNAPATGRLAAWLQLLRVPNLFTVPGDPLAGYALACTLCGGDSVRIGDAAFVALASLLLYAAGLIQNDLCDRNTDRVERPNRPIPSGRVGVTTATAVALALAASGVGLAMLAGRAAGCVAALLLTCMTLYNGWVKRLGGLGPVAMGLCRGLSLMLGAAACGGISLGTPAVLVGAVCWTVYVAAVTRIAAQETGAYQLGVFRWIPAGTLAVGLAGVWGLTDMPALGAVSVGAVLGLGAVLWAGLCGRELRDQAEPRVVQQTIGRFLRGLLLMQACLLAAGGTAWAPVAAAALCAWPASQWLARRFYPS
jgi:4-hydroxybenzoate polyprenyltransferase